MRKALSIVLILAGLVIISYPLMEQLYAWYWQQKLLAEWEAPDLKPLEIEVMEEEEKAPLTPQGEVVGVLKIEAIDLNLPIIKGLNHTNLKIGVALLADTAMLEEEGNSVIAGHRGHSRGRLLNRLDEVNVNDRVMVVTEEKEIPYRVFNKVIVEPQQTDLLAPTKEKVLTIVTCEPVRNPTHRLIVQAKPEG